MAIQLKRAFFCLSVLILTGSACQPNVPATMVSSSNADNSAKETLAALILTLTAQASISPSTAPLTQPVSTPTLQETLSPTATPTITVTPSPATPLVSVSGETNCRTGPSKYYEFIWKAEVGETFMVVGRYAPANYWIIKLNDGRECWLWGEYATLMGDVNSLPEYTPPVGVIDGTITEKETDKSIMGVIITIRPADFDGPLPEAFKDSSDSEGYFFFPNVPIGEIIITFSGSSHAFETLTTTLRNGQVFTANLEIELEFLEGIWTPAPSHCPPGRPICQMPPQGPNAP